MRTVADCIACTLVLLSGLVFAPISSGQEDAGETEVAWPLDEEGHLVQFERDIAPILKSRCLECHGPDDAKNDFRVDDRDGMMDYIEPEDVESSTIWADYLTIDDEDMLMPPTSHGGPLSSGELALIRVWIQEGAQWPDDFAFSAADESEAPAPVAIAGPKSLGDRIWAAQGFLHPAMVHFPIALMTLGGLFVVVGWKWPSVGTQIPLACLLIGSVSAILATAMGWAFAPERGYGGGWDFFDWGREVDVHRWSGVIMTIASCVFSLIALVAVVTKSPSLNKAWKIGLLLCAAMVGAVGHQGGELSYGADFYQKALRILTGTSDQPAEVVAAESDEPQTEEATSDESNDESES